jgi:seryl-tRNA synthetase
LEVGKDRRSRAVPSPAPVKVVEAAVPAPPIQEEKPVLSAAHAPLTGESDVHDSLRLLQKAHEQLSTRKQSIETELARIEELRSEHEAVTAQVAAIEQAMKTFQQHDAVALSDLHDVDVASTPVKQRRSRPKKGAEVNVPVETKQAEPVSPKSRLSAEGRKRIVEATKKFWAAKRQAAQAVQGPRPTKGSVVSTKKANAGRRARHR